MKLNQTKRATLKTLAEHYGVTIDEVKRAFAAQNVTPLPQGRNTNDACGRCHTPARLGHLPWCNG